MLEHSFEPGVSIGSPRFIYLAGADGTGKTTQVNLLMEYLREHSIRCRHVWLRFPRFLFSIPLLVYARWRGYSWYEVRGESRYGYWNFANSWLLRRVFPWVYLVDVALASLLRVYVPLWFGRALVCDRFVLDMIVDLTVALDDRSFVYRYPGRLFLRFLPRAAQVGILALDAETIRRRRPDLRVDRRLEGRVAAYRRLAADTGIREIDASRPIQEVFDQVLSGNPRERQGA